MGIGEKDLEVLILMAEEGYIPKKASVIEVGAQQLCNTLLSNTTQISKIAKLFKAPLPAPLPNPSASNRLNGLELLDQNAPQAKLFWQWLGLSYKAIDIDGTPHSIPLDLNYDDVPYKEQGRYQLVTNYGTTEHVANQLNAFKIIHDLTAVDGIMIHNLPAQGMPNHGLVNYNPKFFWMLSRSNAYKWLYCDYSCGAPYYSLPQNIVDQVSKFSPSILKRIENYKISDSGLCVVLQKKYATPFVAPLDVQTGTKTDNKSLEERYWSIFKDDPFEGEKKGK